MGLPPEDLKILEIGGLFHDIGKIGVPDSVLLKEGNLTDDEYNEIKNHPSIGKHILSNASTFQNIIPIVYHHHEKFNGHGYPGKLIGEEIPLFARIASVADTFDAMTTKRSYRNALSLDNNTNNNFSINITENGTKPAIRKTKTSKCPSPKKTKPNKKSKTPKKNKKHHSKNNKKVKFKEKVDIVKVECWKQYNLEQTADENEYFDEYMDDIENGNSNDKKNNNDKGNDKNDKNDNKNDNKNENKNDNKSENKNDKKNNPVTRNRNSNKKVKGNSATKI